MMESVVGSVLYQCPELIKHESYGEKADIWVRLKYKRERGGGI
jgi:hypothetical protein